MLELNVSSLRKWCPTGRIQAGREANQVLLASHQFLLPPPRLATSWAPHYERSTELDGQTVFSWSTVETLADGKSSRRKFGHQGGTIR